MPRLSDSMEEGTIVRWLRAEGDAVKAGEEIVEIETDKATMTYEADFSGRLSILAEEGETVAVGSPIASIGETTTTPPAAPSAAAKRPPVVAAAPPSPHGGAAAPSSKPGRTRISPLARRVAAELGVAVDAVTGSGPYGRIFKADVVAAARDGGAATAVAEPAAAASSRPESAKGAVVVEQPSRLQQTIARRMSESKATVPDFVVEIEVDMTAVLELREQARGAEPLPSINDFVLKACARILKEHPRVNGAYRDGKFERYERINVGVAVAAEGALVVPTVFDADRRTLGEIAVETRRLAGRVRDGEVTPPELAGGTFTVSNLGMFGIDRFAGVVNPPQAAILCIGAVRERPAVLDGEVVARPLMTLSLVSDHRVLYGADAASFLADLRTTLESPVRALL